MEIGLGFDVGSKADNLSSGQQRLLALAHPLPKKSPMLMLDEAITSLDNRSQTLYSIISAPNYAEIRRLLRWCTILT